MKQPHQDAFTSKQETFERIKRLHIKCGFLDTENSFMSPKTWLEYQKYEDVHVAIMRNLYNSYCTPNVFLLRKISRVGIPKSTVLVVIFIFFYVAALIEEYGTKKHYPIAMFQNGISKNKI